MVLVKRKLLPWIIKILLFKLAAVGVCIFASLKWLKVRYLRMHSSKINKPIRILLISDLHGNSHSRRNLDIWKKIEAIPNIDLALLCGDVIIRGPQELLPHLGDIKRLASRMAVVYVDGNHDAFAYSSITKMLTNRGVTVLNNRRLDLDLQGSGISIIGLRDHSFLKAFGFKKADAALASTDPARFTICLSHQPQIFDRPTKNPPDLYLCGHTHGGQIRLPFSPTLFAPNQGLLPRYGYGWYFRKKSQMFVTKGVGTTDFPIRFWNRPEVCIIDII